VPKVNYEKDGRIGRITLNRPDVLNAIDDELPAALADCVARANADAGVECGATHLDASVGGLGGCPFAPRATGNIATEDLVYLLENEGVDTGVDLDALIAVAEWLGQTLGRELPGLVQRAGNFAL